MFASLIVLIISINLRGIRKFSLIHFNLSVLRTNTLKLILQIYRNLEKAFEFEDIHGSRGLVHASRSFSVCNITDSPCSVVLINCNNVVISS